MSSYEVPVPVLHAVQRWANITRPHLVIGTDHDVHNANDLQRRNDLATNYLREHGYLTRLDAKEIVDEEFNRLVWLLNTANTTGYAWGYYTEKTGRQGNFRALVAAQEDKAAALVIRGQLASFWAAPQEIPLVDQLIRILPTGYRSQFKHQTIAPHAPDRDQVLAQIAESESGRGQLFLTVDGCRCPDVISWLDMTVPDRGTGRTCIIRRSNGWIDVMPADPEDLSRLMTQQLAETRESAHALKGHQD
jgi:hypothetical protein